MVAQIGDKKVEAGKVAGAGTGANANNTGKKIDAALKAELLQDLIDERKATGGNPIQAILLHQINRFLAGKKPETKLEEKAFAVLKTAPKDTLTDYTKNWEKIPQATRAILLGASAKELDPNKGLDDVLAIPQLKAIRAGGAARSLAGVVKGVTIPTVKCVDETNPEPIDKDEIFAIHTVVVGTGDPVSKKTATLNGFDDGVTKNFAAGNAAVFPLPGQTPAGGGRGVHRHHAVRR